MRNSIRRGFALRARTQSVSARLVAIVLVLATLPAQSAVADDAVATSSIAGTVTDAAGTPLADVLVRMYGRAEATPNVTTPYETTTQADGTYSFSGLPSGTYLRLSFDGPGFGRQFWGAEDPSLPPATIALAMGQSIDGIDARLYRGVSVSLSVECTRCQYASLVPFSVHLERAVATGWQAVRTGVAQSPTSPTTSLYWLSSGTVNPGMLRAHIEDPARGISVFTAPVEVADGASVNLTANVEPKPAWKDFNSDGLADMMIRDSRGMLELWATDPFGTFAGHVVGSGWGSFTALFSPGDFDGDGHADVVARDKAGALYLYPGNGRGGWLARKTIGSGWGSFTTLVGDGDFTGDQHDDILALDRNHVVWLYPGNGSGGFMPRSRFIELVWPEWTGSPIQ